MCIDCYVIHKATSLDLFHIMSHRLVSIFFFCLFWFICPLLPNRICYQSSTYSAFSFCTDSILPFLFTFLSLISPLRYPVYSSLPLLNLNFFVLLVSSSFLYTCFPTFSFLHLLFFQRHLEVPLFLSFPFLPYQFCTFCFVLFLFLYFVRFPPSVFYCLFTLLSLSSLFI